MAGLKKRGIERIEIKPQYDEFRFPLGRSVLIAQLELHQHNDQYEKKVYILPKHLDEEVPRLHLDHLGVKLTTLTTLTPEQAAYTAFPSKGRTRPSITVTDGVDVRGSKGGAVGAALLVCLALGRRHSAVAPRPLGCRPRRLYRIHAI